MEKSGKEVQITFQFNSSAKISPQIMSFQERGLQTKKGITSKTLSCISRLALAIVCRFPGLQTDALKLGPKVTALGKVIRPNSGSRHELG